MVICEAGRPFLWAEMTKLDQRLPVLVSVKTALSGCCLEPCQHVTHFSEPNLPDPMELSTLLSPRLF